MLHGHDGTTDSHGVEVCAYDSSLSGVVQIHCDDTNSNGFYSVRVPLNDPDNDGSRVDLYLRVSSNGTHHSYGGDDGLPGAGYLGID